MPYCERNPPLFRLSPAPNPVTQISRLTPVSSIAVTRTRVASENSRNGEDHFRTGGDAKRLNDRIVPASTRTTASIQRITGNLLQIGMADRNAFAAERAGAHLVT